MSVKYRVHYVESERGWGQDYWHRDFTTREEAQAAYDECNNRNPPPVNGRAPDYYIQANKIEVIDTELKP